VKKPNGHRSDGGVREGRADSDRVDRWTIRRPSGKVLVLSNFKADRHIVVEEDKEGAEAIETVEPGTAIAP
jgi:hypothetical protein